MDNELKLVPKAEIAFDAHFAPSPGDALSGFHI